MERERPSVGDKASLQVTVTEEMLVNLGGRRIHPVYATAWMVRHMEEAARLLIEPHLRPGEDATGYSVTAVHERPARVGDTLTVTARVYGIGARHCEAEVEIVGPRGRVGSGGVVQRFIETGRFNGEAP